MEELSSLTVPELYGRIRRLNQIKHKLSPGRRISKIEREIGLLKKEILVRNEQKIERTPKRIYRHKI